ncbi:MAG: hypothetical protein IJE60_11350 [Tyzzerella sp.]|nr:hypothetical protein [Tyzzerella sp.]
MKKFFTMLLVMTIVLQVIPSAVFVTNAADTSTKSHEDVVNPTTEIKYVWYEDISEYRTSKQYTYPIEDEYVFAGWFTTSAEDDGNEIGTDVTSGSAWAKFVPEETLTVKGQINRDLSDYDTTSSTSLSEVKLRLVTSVDSLKYQSVGFEVTINGKTTDFPIQKVYNTIVLVDSEHGNKIENASSVFCDASAHFATITISGIPNGDNNNFENMEIKVVPYWITKDDTKVTGISRDRMLISDERANDEDGSGEDFTKSGKTYSYMEEKSGNNTASYKYFLGGSDTVYLSGTYTSDGVIGNHFGISIRNGGQTRQVFFDGHGVKVVDGVDNNMDTTGYADSSISSAQYNVAVPNNDGIFVWLEDCDAGLSAVSTMLKTTESSSHEIVWAIYKNMLFCSVDEQITYRIPMENLCSSWQNGRYYQLGVAGYNSVEAKGIKFEINTLEVGKRAKNLLVLESEGLTVHDMAYEPITGSYVAPSKAASVKLDDYAITEFVNPDTAVGLETEIEWEAGSGATAGITIVLDDDDSVQFELTAKDQARLHDEYGWKNIRWISKSVGNLVADFSTDTDGKYHVYAAIYDGKFYVLFNGVTAFEKELKDLFTDASKNITYDGTEKVSIGLTTYASNEGSLTQFHNVKTYFGQDAINMKMKDWTYYPSGSVNTIDSYKIETGFVDLAGYASFTLGTSSDVWQITGTMKHDAHTGVYRAQGFGLSDGTGILRILGVGKGFAYETTSLNYWRALNETNVSGNTQYAFQAYDGYFNSTASASVDFQAIIANNTFYMWLNGTFAWQIPMRALQSAFTTESQFTVNIQNWDSDAKFDGLVVRKGSEVDATLVKTMKSCNNLDWLAANAKYTVTEDGKITLTKKSTGGGVTVFSKEASDTVYMSGTYTNALKDAANMEAVGIAIKDTDGNERRIDLCGYGFRWSTSAESWGDVKYLHGLGNGYLWAQNGNSELYKLVASGTSKTADIVWVIQDNTLYCSVNGMISIILPLNVLYAGWTSESSTQYYMALSVYSPRDGKYADISDFTSLYGDAAKAMLKDKQAVCSGMFSDVKDIVYDAVDGAYIAKYSGNSAGAYGDADSKVALQAEIQWYDQSSTTGGAGISVKSSTTGKSVEFLLMPNNRTLRKLENLNWTDVKDITLPSDIVPFNENGVCNLKAMVTNGTLYLYCNGVEAYQVALSEYLDGYVGEDVKLGIATRNSNEGIAFFRDIKFTMDEVVLADASTTWEVTGTMEQTDLTKILSQGFKIEAADEEGKKSLTLFGQDAGFVVNGDTTYTEYTSANRSILKIADEAYMNFFSSTARTSTEIDFRLRVVDDTLCVWFDDVLIWNIPLTESAFGGFDEGSAYQISLVIEDDFIGNVFKNVVVRTGGEVPILVDLDTDAPTSINENISLSEMSGMIKNTSSTNRVYIEGSSKTWEITGTMKKYNADNYIAHGFTVYGMGADGYMQEQQFYGNEHAYATAETGGAWDFSHNAQDQIYGFHSTHAYFSSNSSASPVSEVPFRLVIADDVLYLFTDGKLSWRAPLTADELGGFEAGSVYQVGFVFTADEGTTAFENVVAKTGEHADTSGVTKFIPLSTTSGITADKIAGTITVNGGSNKDNVVYFRTEESDNRSAKWEISGTMKRSDVSIWSMMGFAVTDGSTTKYFYGQNAGFVVFTDLKYYMNVNDTTVFSNASVPSFFEYGNVTDDEIAFRAVLLEDVLYVYFEGELAWRIPLTDSRFGGFAAGSTYRLGMAQRDAATVYYQNLSVKSGNEVLAEGDFYIRDPFVLADNYNGVETYYMYGTRFDGFFDVFTSPDRMVWTKETPCFVPENDFWGGTTQFYAPEVFKYTNPDTNETAYYMFATFLGSETVGLNTEVRGTAILKSDSPLGPFTEWSDGAVTKKGHDCLDGTLYIENGTPYMIYSHEQTCDAFECMWKIMGGMMYVQLTNDLKGIASNAKHKELFKAEDYENVTVVAEGPFVYTTGNEKYLLWSGYIKGYTQLAIPFTSLGTGINVKQSLTWYSEDGGHGMVFTDFNGQDVMVLHTPNGGFSVAKFLATEELLSNLKNE